MDFAVRNFGEIRKIDACKCRTTARIQFFGACARNHPSAEYNRYAARARNGKGKRVLTYRYDEDFVNMCFMKDYIMMYNQGMARMINYMGGTRFEYKFDIPLQSIVWMSGKDRFVFVNTKTIQQVILK